MSRRFLPPSQQLTPQQIVAELDKYIIGQNEAKRAVAIALRNRWRRMNADDDIKAEIVPNNIMLIGPTGVGKTEVARRLAHLANAPFCKVEASKFTEVGYVGRDVESMVRELVENAVKMVKNEKKIEVEEKASRIVEDQLLDLLLNIKETDISDFQEQERLRENMRQMLRNGELDNRRVEITTKTSTGPNIAAFGPFGAADDPQLGNLSDMLQNLMPKQNKKRKVTIAEAKKNMLEEEMSKLIDPDEVKEIALERAENTGIIFIDEIDKIANTGSRHGGEVSREGVQRDLLPVVEGSTVSTKYGIVSTNHILFIAAGAFQLAKPSDLIPELQGRFPIRVELQPLTKQDFITILVSPKNALTRQYKALLKSENVEIDFTDEAIEAIAEYAYNFNNDMENIGARRLQTTVSLLVQEFMFDVPDVIPAYSHLVVNAELVHQKLSGLLKNKDLGKFIL